MANVFDPSIYKAYDIRGIYPDQLNEDIAYRTGRAYAQLMQEENPGKKLQIIVSKDMRLSSDSLHEQVIKALIDSGMDVVDIGLASTTTFYFAVGFYGYDGGMAVTASHNPKEYNGMKMVRSKGRPVSGDNGIYTIRDLVEKNDFSEVKDKGRVEKKEGVLEDLYQSQIEGLDLAKIKPFKIIIDTANAMASLDVKRIFQDLPCEIIHLNANLDGSFPSHEADPMKPENIKILQDAVLKHKADFGISTDGDGDRYFFVDEKGDSLRQEILRGIMAQISLKEHPGSTVCYDIRPGKITKDMIEESGGNGVVTRVGHSLIKDKMLEVDAVFGGESSGHYFYKFDYGTFEAPTALVLRFLIFLSEHNKPFSEIMKPYQKYYHSDEINSVVDNPDAKIKELADKYQDAEISYLDGITITYDDFWFNVRKSNTEPKLRLNLEAVSKELMKKKRDEVLKVIRS